MELPTNKGKPYKAPAQPNCACPQTSQIPFIGYPLIENLPLQLQHSQYPISKLAIFGLSRFHVKVIPVPPVPSRIN